MGDAAVVLEEAAKGEEGPTLVVVEPRNEDATRRAEMGGVLTHVLSTVEGPILIAPLTSEHGGRRGVAPENVG